MLQAIVAEVSGKIREGCFREGEGGPDGIERTEIQEVVMGSGVGAICGRGETLAKQLLNILFQLGDDQRSFLLSRRPLSSVGLAWYTYRWEGIGLLQEIASAMALAEPGIWWAEMAIFKWAVKKNKHRRRRITGGYLARPELMADTTAILSQ